MADQEKKADARRPAENFIAKLVPDPATPPDLMRLSGYRGASSMEGHVRLYANPELSLYWDIPEADVLHEQAVPADTDPLGAVVLWIKSDSKVVSHLSQQAQGGQSAMNAFTGSAATQAANLPVTFTATETFPRTITPACISPHYFCPPHSLLPYHCQSPLVFCPPSPYVVCHPSPLPYCVQPVSPTCPPTQPTTIPTTIPTTVETGSPFAQQAAAQAAPQAAPQAAAQAFTFGGATFTIPYSIIGCHPSPFIFCPPQSVLAPCTIPHSLLCNSPLVVCASPVTPISPNCPITQPTTIPTTIPTTVQTGSPVAQQAAAQAAPQAAAQAFTFGGGTFPHSIFCPPQSVLILCTFPHSIFCHSPLVLCASPVTPASPLCTPPTIPTTIPTGTETGSFVAGGAGAAAAPQAGMPLGTVGPTVTRHFSLNIHCISPAQGCFPSEILWQCHPSPLPYCPGHTYTYGTVAAQAAAPQAAAQLGTATVATHVSATIVCRPSPAQGCFPSEILWQCHPSFPIHCPVTLGNTYTYTQTVTRTIGTYGTYNTIG